MAKKKIYDHPIWGNLDPMEMGEEFSDDVWTVVKVPGGYIAKRLNWAPVFVPEK